MEKAAVEAEHSVTLQRVEACSSEEAFERRGTELDADDLCEMTVADLRDSFGRFIKVHCSVGSVSSGIAPLAVLNRGWVRCHGYRRCHGT
eukprot:5009932-Prymnesium_polylepis.1